MNLLCLAFDWQVVISFPALVTSDILACFVVIFFSAYIDISVALETSYWLLDKYKLSSFTSQQNMSSAQLQIKLEYSMFTWTMDLVLFNCIILKRNNSIYLGL